MKYYKREVLIDLFKWAREVWKKMARMKRKKYNYKMRTSILAKRKLDYTYSEFLVSTFRPPLASPELEINCGVEKDGKVKRHKSLV